MGNAYCYIKLLDNVTHTLFGATLGRAAFPRAGRGTTAALLLASNAPDIDIVTTAGGTLNYLAWHRGPTHGPLGVLGLGAVTAILVWMWQRSFDRSTRRSTPRFRRCSRRRARACSRTC